MSKCNNSSPGQYWTQPRLFGTSGYARWAHICSAYIDMCLTVDPKLKASKHEFFLTPFRHHEYTEQKWVVAENGQLVNMAIGLRLVAYSIDNKANKWKFEMEAPKEALYKWSFLPVRDSNNFTLCTIDGLKN